VAPVMRLAATESTKSHNPIIEPESVSTPGQRLPPALDNGDTQPLDGVE
jgi:hypothetical protein